MKFYFVDGRMHCLWIIFAMLLGGLVVGDAFSSNFDGTWMDLMGHLMETGN